MIGNTCYVAYVREGAVAIIVEEPAWTRLEDARDAVVAHTGSVGTTAERRVELGELADEKIKFSVVVIVEPDGTRTPTGSGHSSFFCDVGKGAVTIVAVEN